MPALGPMYAGLSLLFARDQAPAKNENITHFAKSPARNYKTPAIFHVMRQLLFPNYQLSSSIPRMAW